MFVPPSRTSLFVALSLRSGLEPSAKQDPRRRLPTGYGTGSIPTRKHFRPSSRSRAKTTLTTRRRTACCGESAGCLANKERCACCNKTCQAVSQDASAARSGSFAVSCAHWANDSGAMSDIPLQHISEFLVPSRRYEREKRAKEQAKETPNLIPRIPSNRWPPSVQNHWHACQGQSPSLTPSQPRPRN